MASITGRPPGLDATSNHAIKRSANSGRDKLLVPEHGQTKDVAQLCIARPLKKSSSWLRQVRSEARRAWSGQHRPMPSSTPFSPRCPRAPSAQQSTPRPKVAATSVRPSPSMTSIRVAPAGSTTKRSGSWWLQWASDGVKHDHGVILSQVQVRDQTNEIPTVRDVVRELASKGCTMSVDGTHVRQDTAQCIRVFGAHYVMTEVKDNQPKLRDNLAAIDWSRVRQFVGKPEPDTDGSNTDAANCLTWPASSGESIAICMAAAKPLASRGLAKSSRYRCEMRRDRLWSCLDPARSSRTGKYISLFARAGNARSACTIPVTSPIKKTFAECARNPTRNLVALGNIALSSVRFHGRLPWLPHAHTYFVAWSQKALHGVMTCWCRYTDGRRSRAHVIRRGHASLVVALCRTRTCLPTPLQTKAAIAIDLCANHPRKTKCIAQQNRMSAGTALSCRLLTVIEGRIASLEIPPYRGRLPKEAQVMPLQTTAADQSTEARRSELRESWSPRCRNSIPAGVGPDNLRRHALYSRRTDFVLRLIPKFCDSFSIAIGRRMIELRPALRGALFPDLRETLKSLLSKTHPVPSAAQTNEIPLGAAIAQVPPFLPIATKLSLRSPSQLLLFPAHVVAS